MLGPSGCGKTTLLKIIAGFELPTSGKVLLDGVDVSDVPPHKRNVNTVFQQYALFPHMSIVDNVAFGLRAKKVPAREARRRALEMLDVVKLGEFADRRSTQLSGGQQQRVALARALVNMPAALLLDEPLAALDLKLREAMQIELKRIQREVGITFIFVTHDQGEALTMSDRIAVMSRGRVEQIGTPEEIYERPGSIFVAGFIGSANLLPGTLEGAGTGAPIAVLDSGVRLALPSAGDARDGDPITVMLRPERIALGAADGDERRAQPAGDGQGRHLPGLVAADDRRRPGRHRAARHRRDRRRHARPAARATQISLRWSPGAAYLLRGRSEIIGATTTDVDEVQATMDGKDVAEAKADDAGEPKRAPVQPPGRAHRRRRRRRRRGRRRAAVRRRRWRRRGRGAARGGRGRGRRRHRPGRRRSSTSSTGPSTSTPPRAASSGTVDRFQDETGISVNYSETFNDNNEVYGKEFAAYLDAGNPTPWDIAAPTYWMAARLKAKGWLAPLPFNLIPNYVNLDPSYLDLAWDRGAKYHLPWQAGITGFAYNISVTGPRAEQLHRAVRPGVPRAASASSPRCATRSGS